MPRIRMSKKEKEFYAKAWRKYIKNKRRLERQNNSPSIILFLENERRIVRRDLEVFRKMHTLIRKIT